MNMNSKSSRWIRAAVALTGLSPHARDIPAQLPAPDGKARPHPAARPPHALAGGTEAPAVRPISRGRQLPSSLQLSIAGNQSTARVLQNLTIHHTNFLSINPNQATPA
jgi:hypothetical protein